MSLPDGPQLADITELRPPCGPKACLSPVINYLGGTPAAWSIREHPDKPLANPSLKNALLASRARARTTAHPGRDGHYRCPEQTATREKSGLARSMPTTGCSQDDSANEGFFERPWNEYILHRNWSSKDVEGPEEYLECYCGGRIKESPG